MIMALIKDFFSYGIKDVIVLVIDNILYSLESITTEECMKCADVDCEVKMLENQL